MSLAKVLVLSWNGKRVRRRFTVAEKRTSPFLGADGQNGRGLRRLPLRVIRRRVPGAVLTGSVDPFNSRAYLDRELRWVESEHGSCCSGNLVHLHDDLVRFYV